MKALNFFFILIACIFGLGILGYISIKYFLPDYTITSWWRSPQKNEEVGGVINSMHLLGLAFDVSPKPSYNTLSKLWWFRTIITSYANHVHLGFAG